MVFNNNEPSKGKKPQNDTKRRYANQKYSKKLKFGRATQKYAQSHQKKSLHVFDLGTPKIRNGCQLP